MGLVGLFNIGRAAGDQFEIESFDMCLVKGYDIGPAELQVTGCHSLHDHGAAGHRHGLQFQAFGLEKTFFHRHKHRRVIDDLHVTELALGLRPARPAQERQAGNADGQLGKKITTREFHRFCLLAG